MPRCGLEGAAAPPAGATSATVEGPPPQGGARGDKKGAPPFGRETNLDRDGGLRAQLGQGVALQQLHYSNPLASGLQSSLFQHRRERHTVFAPREQDSSPYSQHSDKDKHGLSTGPPAGAVGPSHQRPSTTASASRSQQRAAHPHGE